MKSVKIGIVDTTFSRINMGAIALDELARHYPQAHVIRRTVPGIKDLAVECQKLLTEEGCDIAMALGMVGGAPIDTLCGHEASLGIQQAMLRTNKHIIEVFVHSNEEKNEKKLFLLAENRARKHVHNAVWLVTDPKKMIERAGTGRRQGKEDEGAIKMRAGKKKPAGR